jgi:L-rhamnono-1,4-lactonase
MAPSRILDSHIHLWPSTSCKPENHGWMTPGFQLAKRHGISDYTVVSSIANNATPFIYVETDRYLSSASPTFQSTAGSSIEEKRKILQLWAKEPLEEVKFLRRMIENNPQEGDGFADSDGELLKGAVLWAPFHLPPELFRMWLSLAEEAAGEKLWQKIVGFRYLLQGKAPGAVKSLTQEEDWIENIVSLRKGRKDGKGWAFDIGVDTHRDGVEMLEHMLDMVQRVRKIEGESGEPGHVKFILSKPPYFLYIARIQAENFFDQAESFLY